tara:strand:+ start:2764 stop:2949 length:186 start_codon:yes stop_codon:yes gene_type:complete
MTDQAQRKHERIDALWPQCEEALEAGDREKLLELVTEATDTLSIEHNMTMRTLKQQFRKNQ